MDDVAALVDRICPIIAGHHPAVQSAALADLTSMWLSGTFVMGDRKATDQLRAANLKSFIDTVEKLIPVNEEITRERMEKYKN